MFLHRLGASHLKAALSYPVGLLSLMNSVSVCPSQILGGKAEKSDTVVDSDNGDARVIALHNFSAKSADELTIKKVRRHNYISID